MSLNNRYIDIANKSFQPIDCEMFSITQDFGKQEIQGFKDGRCKIGLEDILHKM